MIKLGLTGSIGMGKTTTADMFAQAGIPVFNADGVVHQLYGKGGKAVEPVARAFPKALVDGAISREQLASTLHDTPEAIKTLESIVHPLVGEARNDFIASAEKRRHELVVFDIPLLFETGQAGAYDAILVVTAPPDVQRARVLSRNGMTPQKFAAMLARQMPDREKRERADFIVDTSKGLEPARKQVADIIETLKMRAKQTRTSPHA